ncbi:MAG: hypothetical protein RLZZ210_844 [Pseudomonadota bacterium]|jgi:cytochrome c
MYSKIISKQNISKNAINIANNKFLSIFAIFACIVSTNVSAQGIPAVVKNNNCVTCHATSKSLMGPSWQDIANKYKNDAKGKDIISASISSGSNNKWGAVPMPASPQLKKEEVDAISKWILQQ